MAKLVDSLMTASSDICKTPPTIFLRCKTSAPKNYSTVQNNKNRAIFCASGECGYTDYDE